MGKDKVVEVRDPVAAATVDKMLKDVFHGRNGEFNNSLAEVLAVKEGEVPVLRESAERVLKALGEIGALREKDVHRVEEYVRTREERKKK